MSSIHEMQKLLLSYLKEKVNEITYKCWFSDLRLKSFESDNIIIIAPDDFKKDVLIKNYMPVLTDAFEELFSLPVSITIVCDNEMSVEPQQASHPTSEKEYTFDTFVVGSSNKYAHAAALAVAQFPAQKYNPLFIYGKSGLGKTHLLKAIAAKINKDKPEMKTISVSCETFTNDYVDAMLKKETNKVNIDPFVSFREKYRNTDVLLIDDIQFIIGKEGTQEAFFNTFEALYNANKQIVITSDRPPKEIKTLDERLRSRFEQGIMTDIQSPELETRVAIIQEKAEQIALEIPTNIAYFIAEQLKTNIRQLEGVVKKLQALIMLNEKMSLTTAQLAIKDMKNDNRPEPVTVEKIIDEVARTYNVSAEDIIGLKRDAHISHARHVAVHIVRELTQMSDEKIGAAFSGRTHTTILHSLKQAKIILENEKDADIVSDIITNFENN